MDIYMSENAGKLVKMVRTKAMTEYFAPYLSVELAKMAKDFGIEDIEGLEHEVASLIMNGALKARIDSHNKIVHARHADARHETYEKVLNMGHGFAREVQSLMLRASLHKNKIFIHSKMQDI